ncbi:hypothetical protein AB0P15_26610 [Streptomyces sp. NPDC087917]|uniref:hypothetical protein n=1 Tax=Streptomyces sp. NPDC087917 TaxID=3155060 RepID=UPI0034274F96
MSKIVGLTVLVLVSSGCAATPGASDEGTAPKKPEEVPVGRICGGTLFSPEGGKALERLMSANRFQLSKPGSTNGADEVAKVLQAAYRAGADVVNMPNVSCEIRGVRDVEGLGRYPSARVRFNPASKHADGSGADISGVTVDRVDTSHTVAFDCVSSRIGSTSTVPLRITADFVGWGTKDRAADPAAAPDYLVVIHSAARAVAKELGCENGGGLPGRPEELERFVRAPVPSATGSTTP